MMSELHSSIKVESLSNSHTMEILPTHVEVKNLLREKLKIDTAKFLKDGGKITKHTAHDNAALKTKKLTREEQLEYCRLSIKQKKTDKKSPA